MNSILSIIESVVSDYLMLASITAIVLVAVAWGIVKMRRVEGSANRHMIWLFALLAIVLLPGIWLHGPKLRLTVLPADSSMVETAQQSPQIDFIAGPMVGNSSGASVGLPVENVSQKTDISPSFEFPPIMTLLAWGWGIGFLLMLIRLTFGGVKLRHLLQTAVPVTDAMGIDNGGRRRIDLLLSSKVDCPVCFGLLRPVILMPTKMYDETSPEDLRMILRHELAHIERKDCWVNLFQRLVEAVLFFHPLVWYASFQLTQQREELCDQHVIAGGASPENYVELLGRIARQGFEKRTLQAVALFEGRLLSRVQSLMGLGGRVQIKASRKALATLAVAVMLCLAAGTVRLEANSGAISTSDTPGDIQEQASFRPQVERLGPSGNRPTGDCFLRGRVVSAATGDPVYRALVFLFYVGTSDSISISPASDGSFSFDDIPNGEYSLSVYNSPGYQNAHYDPEDMSEDEAYFSLVEGEERSGIIFELEPAYSISGKVLDEDGQPISGDGIQVSAWKARDNMSGGPVQYEIEWQGGIGPDGLFSVDSLSGSPVLVMVQDLKSYENNNAYPPCYYPGTVSRDQATLVDFSSGNLQDNIDIRLVRKGSTVLEGIVSDETSGDPVANALLTVHHADMLFDFISAYTDEAGHYRIESLSGGDFLVHIDARPWGYVRTRQPVTLEAGQNKQLDFALRLAAAISGVFNNENGEPIEVYEKAYGRASTMNPAGSEEWQAEWSGSYFGNKYSEKGIRDGWGHIFFSGGRGDYDSCDMVFPTADSFLIEAIMPGETNLSFFPKEMGLEVKKILYNGEDVTMVRELPKETPPVEVAGIATTIAVLETRPGETIEGVVIVLGPVVDSPAL